MNKKIKNSTMELGTSENGIFRSMLLQGWELSFQIALEGKTDFKHTSVEEFGCGQLYLTLGLPLNFLKGKGNPKEMFTLAPRKYCLMV